MKHQLDATLCRFYFCRVTLHVSGAEIKPAQCCIKLVFHLTYTMMHGSTKLKFSNICSSLSYFRLKMLTLGVREAYIQYLRTQCNIKLHLY